MLRSLAVVVAILALSAWSLQKFPLRVRRCTTTHLYSTGSGGKFVPRTNTQSSSAERGGNKPKGDSFVLLDRPQLLIRYRTPRSKTTVKTDLENLQEAYRAQSENSRPLFSQSSGQSTRSNYVPFSFPSSSFGEDKKPGMKAKLGEKKEKERQAERIKSASKEKKKKTEFDTDDDSVDEEYEEDDDDDMGDDEDLSIVPMDLLRSMESEGYTLEEIQLSVYGEFGVKASVNAIKSRMRNDMNQRRSKGKTGKTRRERVKAKIARKNGPVDTSVSLPDGPIQIIALAELIDVSAADIVRHLMMNVGIMSSITSNVDNSMAKEIVAAFGKTLTGATAADDDSGEDDDEEETDEAWPSRPPVVTIMGHVDHGKTTLLDYIRKSQVALGEAGGITQGMTAFKVNTGKGRDVTFIDTPGHAAFSDMRKRGANVTDIVILVVAADDGIMEQTKESISAAKTAGCPIVVAVNKIDKEGANPKNVLTDLTNFDILPEEFGGDVQCAMVSAKKGVGIDDLLDKILIQSDIMNLRTPDDCNAEGTVLDARVDKGQGVIVTALVQKGRLKIGDCVLAGPSYGRVRRILSDQNEVLKNAGPSTPVQIVGLSNVPRAGDTFAVVDDEASAKEVADSRLRLSRLSDASASNAAIKAQASSFADGSFDMREVIKIPVVLKCDVAGSVDAIRASLEALEQSDDTSICKVDVVYSGVGDVTSSDVSIAAVSKAKVLAFSVGSSVAANAESRAANVEIGYYSIVYEILGEVEKLITRTLSPPPPGALIGRAEIKKLFKGKGGKIAGCAVLEGTIKVDSQVRLLRGKRNQVFSGKLSSLRVVKDSVAEVPVGSECGLSFEKFEDFEEGDIIECFVVESGEDGDGDA